MCFQVFQGIREDIEGGRVFEEIVIESDRGNLEVEILARMEL
jgi:hypothetical protein